MNDVCPQCGAYWDCECSDYSRYRETHRGMRRVQEYETAKFHGYDNFNPPKSTISDFRSPVDELFAKIDEFAVNIAEGYGLPIEKVTSAIFKALESCNSTEEAFKQLRDICIQVEKQFSALAEEKRYQFSDLQEWFGPAAVQPLTPVQKPLPQKPKRIRPPPH